MRQTVMSMVMLRNTMEDLFNSFIYTAFLLHIWKQTLWHNFIWLFINNVEPSFPCSTLSGCIYGTWQLDCFPNQISMLRPGKTSMVRLTSFTRLHHVTQSSCVGDANRVTNDSYFPWVARCSVMTSRWQQKFLYGHDLVDLCYLHLYV